VPEKCVTKKKKDKALKVVSDKVHKSKDGKERKKKNITYEEGKKKKVKETDPRKKEMGEKTTAVSNRHMLL